MTPEESKKVAEHVSTLAPQLRVNPSTGMMPLESYVLLVESLVKVGLVLKTSLEQSHTTKRRELLKSGDL